VTQVERADAARNRQAILDAADELFASADAPASVSMDDVARVARVGKGTLFRRFGDRNNLIRQVYAARIGPVRAQIEAGPPPLGPATPPLERVAAIIDAIARLKLDNVHLMAALEGGTAGASGSHFSSPDYKDVHLLLSNLINQHKTNPNAPWIAHVLLGTVRADFLRHLTEVEGMTGKRIRSQLRAFVWSTVEASS
jgi:AcrR family transcriptional regulator